MDAIQYLKEGLLVGLKLGFSPEYLQRGIQIYLLRNVIIK